MNDGLTPSASRRFGQLVALTLGMFLSAFACGGAHGHESRGMTIKTGVGRLGDGMVSRCALGTKNGLPLLTIAVAPECDTKGDVNVEIEMQNRGTQRLARAITQSLRRSKPDEFLPENSLEVDHLLFPDRRSLIWTSARATCTNRVRTISASATCRYDD